MSNVGNKKSVDITTQDDEATSDNSDKPSHTNTCTQKKTAPIVVLGGELNAVQEMLLKTVADKKFAIRISLTQAIS